MRDWMSSVDTTHYILGSVVGPHPFPRIVRDFQSVIGRETIEQCRAQIGRLPNLVVACVGGGSNAAGMFYPFVEHTGSRAGRRRSGRPLGQAGRPCGAAVARLARRAARQLQLRDARRRRPDVRRALVSAGLDYPGVGPEHSYWKDSGRVKYTSCRDDEALAAFDLLARTEGILPALESSHAIAKAMELAGKRGERRMWSAFRAAAIKTRPKSPACAANRSVRI